MSTISFSKALSQRDGSQHTSSNREDQNSLSKNQGSLSEPQIVVIGVGGAGSNAINNMIIKGINGVKLFVANTDNQSLEKSLCENKIQLGSTITNGLGAGSSPDIGEQAAYESQKQIEDAIRGANMVFVACGMGGGTGTGAGPIIAKFAREMGILTIGVVTKPFKFERDRRMKSAEFGIQKMTQNTDTLIVISNQNVFRIANEQTTLTNAFATVDDVLFSGIRCITDLITKAGLVNLDFADVASVMSHGGRSVMGEGEAEGEDRAVVAAQKAITNPILEVSSVKDAKGILINITGGSDMTLFEVNDAIERITQEIDQNAIIKFGSIIEDGFDGKLRVSVVATGVNENEIKKAQEQDEDSSSESGFFFLQKNRAKSKDAPSQNLQNEPQEQDLFSQTLNNQHHRPQNYAQQSVASSSFYHHAYGQGINQPKAHNGNSSWQGSQAHQHQTTHGNNPQQNPHGHNAHGQNVQGQYSTSHSQIANDVANGKNRYQTQQSHNNYSPNANQQMAVDETQFLANVKNLSKTLDSNSSQQFRQDQSRKIIITDEQDETQDEIAIKSVDRATSFFTKLLKKK